MKKYIVGALVVLIIFLTYRYFENRNAERDRLEESTAMIQQQIKNVGKLVVTEGTFSQVFTYNDTRNRFFDVLPARKKALIVVNTRATVAYDLSKLEIELDEENKTVHITHIPKEEINIYPDIKYYDITQDYLNQFSAEDYNKIKTRINKSMREKVEKSTLKSNAQNRLISELQKIYILTSTLGWTLTYNNEEFGTARDMEELKL
ncbi:MAG: DUF4230 domain-containing protein [Salinimicrobium sediminis]|uniref:DUF4230 domain-containing protein n=1 Tax=Salinimicrobium sediminis TaxID=1343891 RepID=A0A285X0K6_9FLAO|nr:DUF4230 domain-containing protein [Salinimicrobium sediminis]MDX1604047.1 DUF4230 domain-containing protein [Salinimicrobium sediminis]SOC78873.1 Protein of unknown function [Salinimicrobium sediminis]